MLEFTTFDIPSSITLFTLDTSKFILPKETGVNENMTLRKTLKGKDCKWKGQCELNKNNNIITFKDIIKSIIHVYPTSYTEITTKIKSSYRNQFLVSL